MVIFLICSVFLVLGLFCHWLKARKCFFDACDEYTRLTGKKHDRDFR